MLSLPSSLSPFVRTPARLGRFAAACIVLWLPIPVLAGFVEFSIRNCIPETVSAWTGINRVSPSVGRTPGHRGEPSQSHSTIYKFAQKQKTTCLPCLPGFPADRGRDRRPVSLSNPYQ